MKKFTVADYKEHKNTHEKITMVTAYDYSTAKIVEEAGIESILVGDSLGMTMLGYKDTLAVTVEDMIHHGKAVVRGAQNPLVVIDMPFLSYHISDEKAVENAGRIIKETGADAVKLEGGEVVKSRIKAIIDAQIPVMGHIGLTPQSINAFGGFKVQGKSLEIARKLIKDAKLLEEIGCFAIVIEAIPAKLATLISESVSIPTIGIGAGNGCDGQVLVIQDLLGQYSDFVPKFVKQYANLRQITINALSDYSNEVKQSKFPAKEHTFKIDDSVMEELLKNANN